MGEEEEQRHKTAGPSAAQPAFAIFEGGGAKGITHVGALKAIEDQGLVLVGVAGTSAGAIIAALAAVGYSADELLAPFPDGNGTAGATEVSPERPSDILQALGYTPVSVLGRWRWFRFRLVAHLLKPIAILAGAAIPLWILSVIFGWISIHYWIEIILLSAALVMSALLAPALIERGLFNSKTLRIVINEALRQKLAQHYKTLGIVRQPPTIVRFEDIDPQLVPLCAPLKIIVSDIRSGQLVLFDRKDDCVAVADAVSANTPNCSEPQRSGGRLIKPAKTKA